MMISQYDEPSQVIILYVVTELMENETLREEAGMASNVANFSIEDFTYENNIIQQIMFRHLTDTNFTGVTVSPICSMTTTGLYIRVHVKCDK